MSLKLVSIWGQLGTKRAFRESNVVGQGFTIVTDRPDYEIVLVALVSCTYLFCMTSRMISSLFSLS